MEYELCLMHWGIKGQRWGVRKYQNPDGSLTAAGKARYASSGATPRHKPSEARKKARYEAERASLLEKGGATDLLKNRKKYNFTDAELKKASERIATKIEVDRKLKELSDKELAKGKSFIDKTVDTATAWKDRVEKGINVWNVVAKIHNSFVDEDDAWQKIGEKSVKEAAKERREKKLKELKEKADQRKKDKIESNNKESVLKAYEKGDIDYSRYIQLSNQINRLDEDQMKRLIKKMAVNK